MTTTVQSSAPPTPQPASDGQRKQPSMARVATAACIGTTIEYYDFFIYGTAAALVFPQIFFPALGATAGTVASFATFSVAFIARPLGAILFGHYGDKLGRKKTLVTTLFLMGVATVLIGLLPTAATIGILAPIALIVLRFAQGLAVGGEWAGANLLAVEYAPEGKRGFYAVFPQLGPAFAFLLSSGTFLISDMVLGEDSFMTYGWRVPFILSGLLVLVGLYIRMNIDETPVFKADAAAAAAQPETRKMPFLDVIKTQPREILFSGGLMGVFFGFFYMGTSYLTAYGTTNADLERQTVLSIGIVASLFLAAATVLGGWLSDKVGRKPVIITAAVIGVPWSLALFPLLDQGTSLAFGVGVTVTLVLFGIAFGPVGAYLPELFETRFRYTGAGTGYNLGGVLGGAIPPLLAPGLTSSFGSIAVGVMLAGLALISILCTAALTERSKIPA